MACLRPIVQRMGCCGVRAADVPACPVCGDPLLDEPGHVRAARLRLGEVRLPTDMIGVVCRQQITVGDGVVDVATVSGGIGRRFVAGSNKAVLLLR